MMANLSTSSFVNDIGIPEAVGFTLNLLWGIQQAGWTFRNLLLQALLHKLLSCCAYFLSFLF